MGWTIQWSPSLQRHGFRQAGVAYFSGFKWDVVFRVFPTLGMQNGGDRLSCWSEGLRNVSSFKSLILSSWRRCTGALPVNLPMQNASKQLGLLALNHLKIFNQRQAKIPIIFRIFILKSQLRPKVPGSQYQSTTPRNEARVWTWCPSGLWDAQAILPGEKPGKTLRLPSWKHMNLAGNEW